MGSGVSSLAADNGFPLTLPFLTGSFLTVSLLVVVFGFCFFESVVEDGVTEVPLFLGWDLAMNFSLSSGPSGAT